MKLPETPDYYRHWKWMAPAGLACIGLGLSLTGQGIIWKMDGSPWWWWVLMGTIGLVATNSGISIFGDALKRKFWLEVHEQQTKDGSHE